MTRDLHIDIWVHLYIQTPQPESRRRNIDIEKVFKNDDPAWEGNLKLFNRFKERLFNSILLNIMFLHRWEDFS